MPDAISRWSALLPHLSPPLLAKARLRASAAYRSLELAKGADAARAMALAGLESLTPPMEWEAEAVAPMICLALLLKTGEECTPGHTAARDGCIPAEGEASSTPAEGGEGAEQKPAKKPQSRRKPSPPSVDELQNWSFADSSRGVRRTDFAVAVDGYRLQNGATDMPKESSNHWTGQEDEVMPGTSAYANASNIIADMVFGDEESVTGENYTRNIEEEDGSPQLWLLASDYETEDAPGAEVVIPNARVAGKFSKRQVWEALREVIGRDYPEALEYAEPTEEFSDEFAWDDYAIDAVELLRNQLRQAATKSKKDLSSADHVEPVPGPVEKEVCTPGHTAARDDCTPATPTAKPDKKPAAKPNKEGKVPERQPSEKAARALASAKRVDKNIQRYAEEFNEPRFAKLVGGKSYPDSEPVDVTTKSGDGVELKTMVDNANGKITMDSYAQVRKIVWEQENGKQFHTVISDDSACYPESCEAGQRTYYYRRGVAGSARIANLYKCKDETELLKMMKTSEDKLPEAAQRTDGKLRVGKWEAFKDDKGKGFRNSETGQEFRAKK